MRFSCTVSLREDGRWVARHASAGLGAVEAAADTRQAALTRLRDELQYRIELCPCSGVSGDRAELEVSESR